MPRTLRRAAAVLLAALLLAACAAAPSFDPARPCVVDGQAVDGRAAGAFPDLEARVPTSFDGRSPNRLDSGRNCSSKNLGTLAARGVAEVRFGGGLWEVGSRSGVTLAVFTGQGLTAPILFEFYESGARVAPKTDNVQTSDVAVGGAAGRRLDTLNDQSFQTIVTWPGPDGTVRVVLVGTDVQDRSRTDHEAEVTEALAAFPVAK